MKPEKSPRILIVDDEQPIRAMLSAAFGMAGYEVQTAADATEAMALFGAEPFDAVLSDVMMPRMTGHELAKWIAVRHPRTQTVLMSGYDVACEECPLAPRCSLLQKPFRPSEAISMIEKALGQAAS